MSEIEKFRRLVEIVIKLTEEAKNNVQFLGGMNKFQELSNDQLFLEMWLDDLKERE